MRIQVGNDLVNIRKTGTTLWYPKRVPAVIKKMDTLYERISPDILQWNVDKPKVDNIKEIVNPDVPALEPFRTKKEREEKKKLEFDSPENGSS